MQVSKMQSKICVSSLGEHFSFQGALKIPQERYLHIVPTWFRQPFDYPGYPAYSCFTCSKERTQDRWSKEGPWLGR